MWHNNAFRGRPSNHCILKTTLGSRRWSVKSRLICNHGQCGTPLMSDNQVILTYISLHASLLLQRFVEWRHFASNKIGWWCKMCRCFWLVVANVPHPFFLTWTQAWQWMQVNSYGEFRYANNWVECRTKKPQFFLLKNLFFDYLISRNLVPLTGVALRRAF